MDQVVGLIGLGVPAAEAILGLELVGGLHVAGELEDLHAFGAKVVGQAEEGLDLGDVVLVEDLAEGTLGYAGVDGGQDLVGPETLFLGLKRCAQLNHDCSSCEPSGNRSCLHPYSTSL